ncbi:MAG TPA: thioredoxin-like domain-containing protein [Planctomycetota bacterium]|nr:thioredoxin-like domain-containing protein [Planctomycetota bacterium]
MHIFPDLKRLEEKYAKELTVVGIHSAKFTNEKATENIKKAAQRHNLTHPIANDNTFDIWQAYGVKAWPTLILIDPQGKIVGKVSGEGNYAVLDEYIAAIIKVFDEKKLIDREKVIGKAEKLEAGVLKFPAKIIAQENPRRLFIADTNNHRILVADEKGVVTDIIGSGKQGRDDGDFAAASFYMPHGMAVTGDTLYVADCENHLIRKVDLKTRKVETIAGTGEQVNHKNGGAAKTTPLNSPWDVLLSPDLKTLYIAMAGDHRIWHMDLEKNEVHILAGNGAEDIIDGPFANSSYAQPSGLALDGDKLYIADSEGSAIRVLDLKARKADTVIGFTAKDKARLFIFGDVDGALGTAKLQHPLAVQLYNGKLLVADTYNHKIKEIDPVAKTAKSLIGAGHSGNVDGKGPAAKFNEPSGLALLGETLFVADTNNHAIRMIDLKTLEVKTLEIKLPGK